MSDPYETAARDLLEKVGRLDYGRKFFEEELRKHFPPRGMCGECRWWGNRWHKDYPHIRFCLLEEHQRKDDRKNHISVASKADISCPRFKPRETKAQCVALRISTKIQTGITAEELKDIQAVLEEEGISG